MCYNTNILLNKYIYMDAQQIRNKKIVSIAIAVIIVLLIAYGLMKAKVTTPVLDSASVKKETKNMKEIAEKGDVVSMNYTGKLVDGKVFDSNIDPKFMHVEPLEFKLGVGQVILGWDEGIVGMKIGEKKTLTIAPEKAYGARGQGPIPPNSTLIFDVELLGIK